MKKFLAAAATALTASATLVGVTSSADADISPIAPPVGGILMLTVGDAAYVPGQLCTSVPVTMRAYPQDNSTYHYYLAGVSYRHPDRPRKPDADHWFWGPNAPGPGAHSRPLTLCRDRDAVGPYTGDGEVSFWNETSTELIASVGVRDDFHVWFKSSLTMVRDGNRFAGTLRADGRPTGGRPVEIQQLVNNAWTTVATTTSSTTSPGWVGSTGQLGSTYRFVYRGNGTTLATVSPSVAIPKATTALAIKNEGTKVLAYLKRNNVGYAGAGVVFEQRTASGSWAAVSTQTTSSTGWAGIAGQYGVTYRALFRGDSTAFSSSSATLTVPRATSTLTYLRTVVEPSSWRVDATLGGPLNAGRAVWLEEYVNGAWRPVKYANTDSSGKAVITHTPAATQPSGRPYRLRYAGSTSKAAVATGTFYLWAH